MHYDITLIYLFFRLFSKNRYHYELILQDTISCVCSHNFLGDNRNHHQIPYNFESYEVMNHASHSQKSKLQISYQLKNEEIPIVEKNNEFKST